MKEKPKNPWVETWKEMIGAQVKIGYYIADQEYDTYGTLHLFNFNKDSCFIKEKDGTLRWIRTPIYIQTV